MLQYNIAAARICRIETRVVKLGSMHVTLTAIVASKVLQMRTMHGINALQQKMNGQ